MLFNTYQYFLFLTLVYLTYRALDHRRQNQMLLVASLLFYAAWSWKFVSLLLLSAVVDFHAGRAIHHAAGRRARRGWLLLSLCFNLGVLGVFKYYDFFATSLAQALAPLGFRPSLPLLHLVLPIGISFYTFQSMSYTIDIYRRQLEPERSIRDYALFVAFFPHMVAGPIMRPRHLLSQLVGERRVSWMQTKQGLWLILLGLFKKAVVADNIAVISDSVFDHPGAAQGLYALAGVYAFAFQVYCDFSGYTDIARGSAKLFGIELTLNFNLPYLAVNPSDFWRRWHISLSTWLRDYVFLPVGYSFSRTMDGVRWLGVRDDLWIYGAATVITMLLCGLWHGAAGHFVAWGAFHGALLVVHRSGKARWKAIGRAFRGRKRLWWALRVFVVFHLVCLGWILFRADSVASARIVFVSLFQPAALTGPQLKHVVMLGFLLLPLVGMQLAKELSGRALEYFETAPFWLRANAVVYCLLMVLLWSAHRDMPFIYFQF